MGFLETRTSASLFLFPVMKLRCFGTADGVEVILENLCLDLTGCWILPLVCWCFLKLNTLSNTIASIQQSNIVISIRLWHTASGSITGW